MHAAQGQQAFRTRLISLEDADCQQPVEIFRSWGQRGSSGEERWSPGGLDVDHESVLGFLIKAGGVG